MVDSAEKSQKQEVGSWGREENGEVWRITKRVNANNDAAGGFRDVRGSRVAVGGHSCRMVIASGHSAARSVQDLKIARAPRR